MKGGGRHCVAKNVRSCGPCAGVHGFPMLKQVCLPVFRGGAEVPQLQMRPVITCPPAHPPVPAQHQPQVAAITAVVEEAGQVALVGAVYVETQCCCARRKQLPQHLQVWGGQDTAGQARPGQSRDDIKPGECATTGCPIADAFAQERCAAAAVPPQTNAPPLELQCKLQAASGLQLTMSACPLPAASYSANRRCASEFLTYSPA